MADKTKVLANPATILIGPKGESATNVGFTQGGVSITPSRDTTEITADQTKYPLWLLTTRRGAEINFRLMEVTPNNIKLGWGEPGKSGDGADEISIGAEEDTPPSYVVKIYAVRMDGKYVIFTFHDCTPSGAGALNLANAEAALIEGTFTALYDDTNGRIGLMEVSDSAPAS